MIPVVNKQWLAEDGGMTKTIFVELLSMYSGNFVHIQVNSLELFDASGHLAFVPPAETGKRDLLKLCKHNRGAFK